MASTVKNGNDRLRKGNRRRRRRCLSSLLCFVHGQGQNREQKPRTKNFVEFHNHSPPLTMVQMFIYRVGRI